MGVDMCAMNIFVESVFSFHLYLGFKDGPQVTRLALQMFLPSKPSGWQQHQNVKIIPLLILNFNVLLFETSGLELTTLYYTKILAHSLTIASRAS